MRLSNAAMGRGLMVLSIGTRFGVLVLICLLALWTEYLNLKVGYGNARLVELSAGWGMRLFYEASDAFFSFFGDAVVVAQKNAGMTWSIRVGGVPFTDPVALLSVLLQGRVPELGFALGVLLPLLLAAFLGRVFCAYVCPASLLFFAIARVRRLLGSFFYFFDLKVGQSMAWGLLCGSLAVVLYWGHGVWTLILPYFAMGQTIFHSIALGALSVSAYSLVVFTILDLCLGLQFTCRYVCPTGRLLGWVGHRARVVVRREATRCVQQCTACADICPLAVSPKLDQTRDCSLCGECLVACPTQCLSIGRKSK